MAFAVVDRAIKNDDGPFTGKAMDQTVLTIIIIGMKILLNKNFI